MQNIALDCAYIDKKRLSLCFDNQSFNKSNFIVKTKINQLYTPQTNGDVSPSIMQNWTKQAIECYEINSNCELCSLKNGNYSFVCQMPKIVNALVKTYGPPELSS